MKVYLNQLKKNSRIFSFKELKFLIIKMMLSDLRLFGSVRFYYSRFIFDSYITKFRILCMYTFKTRGVLHFFNVFRMFFRKNALFSKYAGIKKHSW